MNKKRFFVGLVSLLMGIFACLGAACNVEYPCDHAFGEWKKVSDPTCTVAGQMTRQCPICLVEETKEIEALGHDWEGGNCTTPNTCKNCNATDGEAPGHDWKAATCTTPQVCIVCQEVGSGPLGHSWVNATCDTPKTCETCQATEGDKLGHAYGEWVSNGDGTHSKACANDASHKLTENCAGGEATCEEKAVCEACNTAYGEALGHAYGEWISNGNGTHSKTCANDASHKLTEDCAGGEATCKEKAVCEACNTAYGDLASHSWVNATCDTPKTCETCQATEGDKLGHAYGEWVSNGDGTHSKTCANDASHKLTEDCAGGEATCEEKAVCEACNAAYGDFASHSWVNATCDTPKTCETCQATEGDKLGHAYGEWVSNGDGTHSKICANDASHKLTEDCAGGEATCAEKAVCETCNAAYGEFGHAYGEWVSNGDGTHSKICANDASHKLTENCAGGEATCEEKAVCETCNTAYGDEPKHNWNDGEVTTEGNCLTDGVMTYTCIACGETRTETITGSGEHNYTTSVTQPTCTAKGYTTYQCQLCSDSYTANEVEATGHSWNQEQTCENGRVCTACDASEEALGHSYAQISSSAATCTAAASTTYKCATCEHEYTETTGEALGHNISGAKVEREDALGDCIYVQIYKCKTCNAEVKGDEVERHTHVASITTAATCCTDGEKTLVCSACQDTKTEVIEKNATGHNWQTGAVVDGKRTDTCLNCSATKEVTVYEGTTTSATNASAFKDTEIELNSANISLDQGVIDAIGDKQVTLSAEKLEGDDRTDLGLSDKEMEQVGNSPIYNFTISDGTNHISQFGEENYVTITLPYTLTEGEDVDSIAVWFINDDGKLESIKATYNNGYVTFQTNHFSYYTVTRLTPEQRCELYGHSYRTSNVVGDCLNDSYTLKVCVRCHDTVKTVTVEADGHDYQATTTEATCTTRGKIVYTCADCGHSYTKTINAIGHKWVEVETVKATCAAPGYTKYVCENCDKERQVTYKQLMHVFTVEVVDATCETYGYTTHSCRNCDYSYQDNIVKAFGHSYVYNGDDSWLWAEDYSSAQLVLGCSHDETHFIYVDATISVEEEQATCTKAGVMYYTAEAFANDKTHQNVKVVAGDAALGHKFSEEYKFDKYQHWNECSVCGAKENVTAHEYDDGVETVKPTCVEKGEMVYTCACGYQKTEVVPATGKHTYEDGVCVECGKEDVVCDHVANVASKIDLADFGTCGGIVTLYTCECGEVSNMDLENFRPTCQIETTKYEQKVDENGVPYMYMEGICEKCGLFITCKATMEMDGCTMSQAMAYVFYMNDEEILAASGVVSWDNHDTEYVYITFEEYSSCGTIIGVNQCTNCQEYTYLDEYNVQIGCNYGQRPEPEKVTDENGNLHYVTKVDCVECGLLTVIDVVKIYTNSCEYVKHVSIKVTYKDETLFDATGEMDFSDHNYDYTYELEGEDCDDGVKVFGVCTICGHEIEYGTNGHSYDYGVKTDFKKYGACGGYLMVDQCRICGKVLQISGMEFACPLENPTFGKRVDENGIERQTMHTSCPVCGLVMVQEQWTVEMGGCFVMQYGATQLWMGEQCIFDTTFAQEDARHVWSEEYEFYGETCEEGYTVYQTCQLCGETNEDVRYDHRKKENYVDLKEKGACGGVINGWKCEICDYTFTENVHLECTFYDKPVETQITDENGLVHNIAVETCTMCGLTRTLDHYVVLGEKCYNRYYTTQTIVFNGETLYENTYWIDDTRHDYEQTFEAIDGNCDNGYFINQVCRLCGHTAQEKEFGHTTYEVARYQFEDYGLCKGVVVHTSCACGEYSNSWHDSSCSFEYVGYSSRTDENGVRYETQTYQCATCGLVKAPEYYSEQIECEYKHYCTVQYSLNGELVFPAIKYVSYNTYYHVDRTSFELYGEDCDDGYAVVTTCTRCGREERQEDCYGHNTYYTNYNLSDYGCAGEISVWACACGKQGSYNLNVWHTLSSERVIYQDENGIYHNSIVRTCKNGCGPIVTLDTYVIQNGCRKTTYKTFALAFGDEVWVEPIITEAKSENDHTYIHETEYNNGENCEGGYKIKHICTLCGSTETLTYTTHSMFAIEKYDMLQYGACGGWIYLRTCPCGAQTEFDDNIRRLTCSFTYEDNSHEDENGVFHTISIGTCQTCGLIIESDSYIEQIGCKQVEYATYTVILHGETLISKFAEIRKTTELHVFTTSWELLGETCEDGYNVIQSCQNCDYTNTVQQNYHQRFMVYDINLTQYGACNGYVQYEACPCGYDSSCGISVCYDNFVETRYMGDDGHMHTVYTYTCSACGLRYQHDRYSIRNASDCTATAYVHVSLVVGDTAVIAFDFTEPEYSKHDYEITHTFADGVTSCQDGVTTTFTCKDCEHSYNSYETWHNTYEVKRYNLADYGAKCWGYAIEKACACGRDHEIVYDTLCEFDERYCDFWVENVISYGSSYIQTCAVTGSEHGGEDGCGFKIRYANYSKQIEGTCYTQWYRVYQFGYNESTGECAFELTLAYGTKDFNHSYTWTEINGTEDGYTVTGSEQTCSVCGSTYVSKNYYDENNRQVKYYCRTYNALPTDVQEEIKQFDYAYYVNEYGYEQSYYNYQYFYTKYQDGSESWNKYFYNRDNSYQAPFGEHSYIFTSRSESSNGSWDENESAYTFYKGYVYQIYNYQEHSDGYWYKLDNVYDFTNGCKVTETFVNKGGVETVTEKDCHHSYSTTLQAPTCTQNGLLGYYCEVCEQTQDSELSAPYGHDWIYNSDAHYTCSRCGLESENGADGSVVMEDLTEKYGNGTDYVVGYWQKDGVEYEYYVSLYFEDGYEEILVDFVCTEIDGARAYAINKAAITEIASDLGYEEDSYDVRFTFVPVGGEGMLDYGLTFTA